MITSQTDIRRLDDHLRSMVSYQYYYYARYTGSGCGMVVTTP